MKTITLLDLKIILHRLIDKHGGIRPAARALGVRAMSLIHALKPGNEPYPSVVQAIGYRKVTHETRYERAK